MKNNICVLLLAVSLLSACQSPKDRYQLMADELCKCMGPIAEFQKRFSAVQATGDMEKMKAMLDEYQNIMEAGNTCALAIEEKYGSMSGPDDMAKADSAFRKSCPEIVALLQQEEPLPPVSDSTEVQEALPATDTVQ